MHIYTYTYVLCVYNKYFNIIFIYLFNSFALCNTNETYYNTIQQRERERERERERKEMTNNVNYENNLYSLPVISEFPKAYKLLSEDLMYTHTHINNTITTV